MSTTNQFARVPIPATGMLYDRHPNQVGLEGVSDCLNWLPYDLRLKTRPGTIETGDPFSPVTVSASYEFPMGVYQFDNGTIDVALVCETTVDTPDGSGFYGTIRSYSAGAETWDVVDTSYCTTNIITRVLFCRLRPQRVENTMNWVIFLNGEDDLAYWDGASAVIETAGRPQPV